MSITDILNTRHIEGETLYNKGRNDLCSDFKKNVHLYEETGEQEYKDKATGRYYHRLLWQGIINYIAEGKKLSWSVNDIKKRVLKEQKLPTPWRNLCYACITHCDECPISKAAMECYKNDSAFSLFKTRIERQQLSMLL